MGPLLSWYLEFISFILFCTLLYSFMLFYTLLCSFVLFYAFLYSFRLLIFYVSNFMLILLFYTRLCSFVLFWMCSAVHPTYHESTINPSSECWISGLSTKYQRNHLCWIHLWTSTIYVFMDTGFKKVPPVRPRSIGDMEDQQLTLVGWTCHMRRSASTLQKMLNNSKISVLFQAGGLGGSDLSVFTANQEGDPFTLLCSFVLFCALLRSQVWW